MLTSEQLISFLSKIEDMAYLYLAIHCEKCDEEFEIGPEAFDPVENWAKEAASAAVKAGWKCIDEKVICPNCLEIMEPNKR